MAHFLWQALVKFPADVIAAILIVPIGLGVLLGWLYGIGFAYRHTRDLLRSEAAAVLLSLMFMVYVPFLAYRTIENVGWRLVRMTHPDGLD